MQEEFVLEEDLDLEIDEELELSDMDFISNSQIKKSGYSSKKSDAIKKFPKKIQQIKI